MPRRVVVIGAGIVGCVAALRLTEAGHQVTVVDPEGPGNSLAASFGHACWISPASVVPMSTPGLWRRVPRMLLDRDGPLVIRWRSLPALAPWLLRFLLAGCTAARVEATARALALLLSTAPQRHLALAAELGAGGLIERNGLLYVYPDRRDFLAEGLSWRLRREAGLSWTELDAAELRRQEPDLSERYRFGILVTAGAHCTDPVAYIEAIAGAAKARGAVFRRGGATGFDVRNGRLRAVRLQEGEIVCDRAVLCAGAWSQALARLAGDRIPLASERGYHAVIADPAAGPRRPIMPSDGKMGNTMTRAGLRVAGQVELAGMEVPPDWHRVDILLRHAAATFPGLGAIEGSATSRWFGHRPSTPDGLPVLGRASASADIIHGFGHGHVGFASSPATAEAIVALVSDTACNFDLSPFRASRFRGGKAAALMKAAGPRTG